MDSVEVWYVVRGQLHWFGIFRRDVALYVARRVRVACGPAVILPFCWEPAPWQKYGRR